MCTCKAERKQMGKKRRNSGMFELSAVAYETENVSNNNVAQVREMTGTSTFFV